VPGSSRGPEQQIHLSLGVFTGIEAAGILPGYALFWRMLGIRRVK
jgi:hypothetical protein